MVAVPVEAARNGAIYNVPKATSSTSSSSVVSPVPPPTRRCPPPVNYKTRGVMPTRELQGQERESLLAALEKDRVAPSTAESRDSCLRTWTWYHERWYGSVLPVLPLTTHSIKAVAAQMKDAGYRTFPNYMTAAKAQHLELHHEWTTELAKARQDSIQSTQRGIGPARQCMEIPLSQLAELQLGKEPLTPAGPIHPMAWAVLSSFHILRGAESALALAESMHINRQSQTESWYLPVSKTDPQAVGCLRTWGCVCRPEMMEVLCPYHAALSLKEELARRFGDHDGNLPEGMPLFPSAGGGWCTKKGFVSTIKVMAERLNLPVLDLMNRSTLGEHVWRVTGARHLASVDVPLPVIKLLARWGSDVIDRYVAEAPLAALTRVYVDRVQAADAAARALAAAASALPAPPHRRSVLPPGSLGVDALGSSLLKPFVMSVTSHRKKVHLVSSPPSLGRTELGKTPCGWCYPASEHTLLCDFPADGSNCRQCGTDTMWGSVHALLSQLQSGYDSD